MIENSKEEALQFVGPVLKGQGWVELRGYFTLERLKAVVRDLEEKNAGLERKNVDPERHHD